jgi:hypothetical protein
VKSRRSACSTHVYSQSVHIQPIVTVRAARRYEPKRVHTDAPPQAGQEDFMDDLNLSSNRVAAFSLAPQAGARIADGDV